MSDDDDKRAEAQLRRTIQFEDIELLLDDEIVIDASDLIEVATQDAIEERTDPFRPALPDSTRQHAVPAEILWQSMRPDDGWMNTYAIVGRNGMLRLSADAFEKLVPGERVEVRVRRLKHTRTSDS